MQLFERDLNLQDLARHFHTAEQGTGHTIFLTGEAGIGKTSLVNQFISSVQSSAKVYVGACDSLFTPRPLGPLFDIASQIGPEFTNALRHEKDRALIFSTLLETIAGVGQPVVLFFEDIHWADEATLDLIKFLARRIYRFKCLFILTYRDVDVHSGHPLTNIFGDLPSGYFSKVQIDRLSKEVVDQMSAAHGYPGEKVFALTGGNPFYVTEVLASYNTRIPERIKDSILTLYRARPDDSKAMWEFLSILPTARIDSGIENLIEQDFGHCIDECIASGVIVSRPGHLSFKHELFRLTIEESLPAAKRKTLHKKMMDFMQAGPAEGVNLAQLVHHARFADEREVVARIAPQAALEAATVGSHIEASKLYATAIEYTNPSDPLLAELYEKHAYECYLIYQIKAAIASQERAVTMWQAQKVRLREGDALRFLSRLWWFEADQEKAVAFALRSIDVLENGFPTRERALAYSNFSQLCMLSDHRGQTLHWGGKAIDLATRMEDKEILSHALNNVGSMLVKTPESEAEGEQKLNESLAIALENGFHEHAARAYVNLSTLFVSVQRYEKAMTVFEVGLKYCAERDLDSLRYYMQSYKVRALFETGRWPEAEVLGNSLHAVLNHPGIVNIDAIASLAKLNIRRGKFNEARALIKEAKSRARLTREAQRIIPIMTAELELAWIGEGPVPLAEIRDTVETLFTEKNNSWHYTALVYWMVKCGVETCSDTLQCVAGPLKHEIQGEWKGAAEAWRRLGCPFEEALALVEGDDDDQKQGLNLLVVLGATATHERLKSRLKSNGLRNIPRGPRASTRSNPAQLTGRQVEILHLLHGGSQSKEIADKLFISPKTVDHHITAILSKLEVHSRSKAIVEAQKLGILK